jgi:hypothetical protein
MSTLLRRGLGNTTVARECGLTVTWDDGSWFTAMGSTEHRRDKARDIDPQADGEFVRPRDADDALTVISRAFRLPKRFISHDCGESWDAHLRL